MEENEIQCNSSRKIMRNPSPPPFTDLEKEVVTADFIGNTLFSKKWILALLLRLYKHENCVYSDKIVEVDGNDSLESEKILDEKFEKELCELWDSSANEEVAMFIFKHQAKEVFMDAIEKTRSPRLVEICFGVLGNLICIDCISDDFSTDELFRSTMLKYLDITDALSLVELTRVLSVAFSNINALPLWLESLLISPAMDCLFTILQNSLNTQLLQHVIQLIDIVFDTDETFIDRYGNSILFNAVKESYEIIKCKKQELVPDLLRILQLTSTVESGGRELSAYDSLLPFLKQCIYDAQNIYNARDAFVDSGRSLLSLYSLLDCILQWKPFEILTFINNNIGIFNFLLNVLHERVVDVVNDVDDVDIYVSVYLEFFHDVCQSFNDCKGAMFDKISCCLVKNDLKIKYILEQCRRKDAPAEWVSIVEKLVALNKEHRVLDISL